MTDHLTAAILAAARLDDTAAAKHLGHVVDLNEPHAVARVTAGRPSLRASMERSGYLASDHDDESAVDLLLRAQTEPNPEILYARLASPTLQRPAGKLIVPYGGGVNTIALLCTLHAAGIVPDAIINADPGREWKHTTTYRDEVARPWLARIGFPDIQVVTRSSERALRRQDRRARFETLAEECKRIKSLPSVAYPPSKKCSLKFKATPQLWWCERQPWVQAEWEAKRRIVKAIGYDAGELRRVKVEFGDPDEAARYVPWYPLVDLEADRAECVNIILAHGLPLPRKSACVWCPNNKLRDWLQLAAEEPDMLAEAIEMEREALPGIESPEVVGFLRGFQPEGRRHLSVWADGGYPELPRLVRGPSCTATGTSADDAPSDEMPCECAL